jgi:hypothetical protein
MAKATSAADVLRKTQEMLHVTQRGLADLLGDDPNMRPVASITLLCLAGR